MTSEARLAVDLRHPPSDLYQGITPRVFLDDAEQSVKGWGLNTYPVPPGDHKLEIWIPYSSPRQVGRVVGEVRVAPGAETVIEYLAPAVPRPFGALRGHGLLRMDRTKANLRLVRKGLYAVVAAAAFILLLYYLPSLLR